MITVQRIGEITLYAMTKQQEEKLEQVRSLAKAFVAEWATFNGNLEDYRERMSKFLEGDFIQMPQGVQIVDSINIKNLREIDGIYEVILTVNAVTLQPKDETQPTSLVSFTPENMKEGIWKNNTFSVKLLLDDKPSIISVPLIIATEYPRGQIKTTGLTKQPSEELRLFVKQFLDIYYNNKSLINFFIKPGSNIKPIEGYELNQIDSIFTNAEETKVLVTLRISSKGIKNIEQRMILDIEKTDTGFLVTNIRN